MHASATGNGRWIGILTVAAAVAAGSVAAGASGVGEREQSEREAHDRAAQEHDTLFISGIGDSYIGVGLREVEDSGTLTVKEGAVVARVIDGSAAAAGIEVGDIIVEFDGQRIRGTRQLRRVVQETPARRTVAASLLRDGARITVQVTPPSCPSPGALTWAFGRSRSTVNSPITSAFPPAFSSGTSGRTPLPRAPACGPGTSSRRLTATP